MIRRTDIGRATRWAIAGPALAFSAAALAGEFDGSRLMICATVEALDCVSSEGCEKGSPEDIGAPAFLRIDISNKSVIGPKQATPIALMEKTEDQLLLQGRELGFGWTISLDQATGKLVATLVNQHGAFVLFGSCTPL
jgi:hypothetical protein